MALMPASKANEFESDLIAIQATMRSGVTDAYANRKDSHWTLWCDFCESQRLDPFLRNTVDAVPYLQIFGARYKDGRIAPRGKPVASGTVSDALRSVGQKFARLGSSDPRLDSHGKIDYRISSQMRSYRKSDAPPNRVKPCPITIVIHALIFAFESHPTNERQAIANMMCLAFFFCLRPGEYTGTTTDDQAFALEDVSFFLGTRRLNNALSPDHEIEAATAIQLTFTTQKNGDKGDVIAHATSGDPRCCTVLSTVRQFMVHRREFCRRNLPYDGKVKLASYYNHRNIRVAVKAAQITATLRWHAGVLESTTGIRPTDLSARSLRAGGAMALLNGNCDSNVIKLLARWHSDAMMRYLHQQSLPIFKKLAVTMFNRGSYSFLPEDWVPAAVATVG